MKIAQFKSLEHGYMSIQQEEFERINGYMRVSDYIEVEFPPRSDEEQIMEEVRKIDQVISDIQQNALAKIEEWKERRAELLALTHQG